MTLIHVLYHMVGQGGHIRYSCECWNTLIGVTYARFDPLVEIVST